jgi:hypothetical protein
MDKRIGLKNINQVILFESVLKPHFVNGHWQNSKPYNHAEDWLETEAYVAQNEKEVGRSFEPVRINYNLPAISAKKLEDTYGHDALNVVKFSTLFGVQPHGTFPKSEEDYENMDQTQKDFLETLGCTEKEVKEVLEDNESYRMKDLRKDLWDMKYTFKEEAEVVPQVTTTPVTEDTVDLDENLEEDMESSEEFMKTVTKAS